MQLQVDIPDDPLHMNFLETLDIDGISEHTQLFKLDGNQVNQILKNTIKQKIENMNLKELLNSTSLAETHDELNVRAEIMRERRLARLSR